MRVVVQDTLKNRHWVAYEGRAGFTVGRSPDCTIALADSKFVSRRHLTVERTEAGWEVQVHPGVMSVEVDGATLGPGDRRLLSAVSQIQLAEYVLAVMRDVVDTEEVGPAQTVEDIDRLQRDIHAAVLDRMDLRRSGASAMRADDETLDRISGIVDELLRYDFADRLQPRSAARMRMVLMALEARLLKLVSGSGTDALGVGQVKTPGHNIALENTAEEYDRRLSRRLELKLVEGADGDDLVAITTHLPEHVPLMMEQMPENVQMYLIARFLKKVVCDMIFGLGPLQDLLDTPSITEIMIVSPTQVYIERDGKVIRSNRTFLGADALLSVIERIVAPLGRRVDRSQPLVDARLPDGSRVNAIIPPLALKGPCLTIRRFPSTRITAADLVRWQSLSPQACALLEASVKGKRNILISGGTGSGKTTLLNVLSSFIPEAERIVTIEDSAELQVQQEHVVSLETRPANVEGEGAVTIRDLIKNALRMRPDRIIVGECRGGEAFDMLQAMNTGHEGSMTTVHANNAADTVARVEAMCLMAVEIPIAAIRQQVAQALDMIVYVRRLPDGRRMVTEVCEVAGINPHTGEIDIRPIMLADIHADRPRLEHNGFIPTFLGDLARDDLLDVEALFAKGSA